MLDNLSRGPSWIFPKLGLLCYIYLFLSFMAFLSGMAMEFAANYFWSELFERLEILKFNYYWIIMLKKWLITQTLERSLLIDVWLHSFWEPYMNCNRIRIGHARLMLNKFRLRNKKLSKHFCDSIYAGWKKWSAQHIHSTFSLNLVKPNMWIETLHLRCCLNYAHSYVNHDDVIDDSPLRRGNT